MNRTWQRPWLIHTVYPLNRSQGPSRLREGLGIFASNQLVESTLEKFALLIGKAEAARRVKAQVPATVIHGDVHRNNCFLSADREDVALVDLSGVARGTISEDLTGVVAPLTHLIFDRMSLDEHSEFERSLRREYNQGVSEYEVQIDSRLLDMNYELQLALNCLRILSRPRMLERWLRGGAVDEATDRARKKEVASFLENLGKRIESLLEALTTI